MTSGTKTYGKLTVFEGPDGVGKSAISERVAAGLGSRGQPTSLLTFPGREAGTLGRLVYDLHHDPDRFGVGEISPVSKQVMHVAAHLDAIEHVIGPTLRAGRDVMLDRFWWSTWVYGAVAGVSRRVLQSLINTELAQWGDLRPALVILLRRSTPLGREHNAGDWLALQREYDALASREQGHYPILIVENAVSLDAIVCRILDTLLAHQQTAGFTNVPHGVQGQPGCSQ